MTEERTQGTFGSRLEEALERKGMSQRGLANALGVGDPTVSGWKTGPKLPGRKNLLHMAQILGVTAEWLTGEDEEGHEQGGVPVPAGQPDRPDPDAEWRRILQTIANAMEKQATANAEQAVANRKAWEQVEARLPKVEQAAVPHTVDRKGEAGPSQEHAVNEQV